jgi:hypothetical protein
MNGIIAIFDSELREEMFLLMRLANVINYTHFVDVHGSGNQGRKQGSIAWPGTNEVFMMVLTNENLEVFKKTISDFKKNRATPPGLVFFHWGLSEVII